MTAEPSTTAVSPSSAEPLEEIARRLARIQTPWLTNLGGGRELQNWHPRADRGSDGVRRHRD